MKALTLTEPWATLMMLQEKRIETRSWRLPKKMIGQPVIIHAAKGYPRWAQDMAKEEPFYSSLYGHRELHRGHGLCVVKFIGDRPTEEIRGQLSEKEIGFGDYSDGRFAWLSEYIERWATPEPHIGHLSFWEW